MLLSLAVTLLAAGSCSANYWNEVHHDIRNSGRSQLDGPADADSTCTATLMNSTAEYSSTGVVSLNHTFLWTAGVSNTVEVIDVESDSKEILLLGNQDAGGDGVAGSPAIYYADDGNSVTEYLYVGSTDGFVYKLNTKLCGADDVSQAVKQNFPTIWPIQAPCLEWKSQMPGEVRASVKVFNDGLDEKKYPEGIVYAVSMQDDIGVYGALVAIDAASGKHLWQFNTTALEMDPEINPNVTTLVNWDVHHTVAYDPTDSFLLFAFGPRFLALDATDGTVLHELGVGDPEDPFVSAISVTSAADFCFVQTTNGTVWRIDIDRIPRELLPTKIELSVAWGCAYEVNSTTEAIYAVCEHGSDWRASLGLASDLVDMTPEQAVAHRKEHVYRAPRGAALKRVAAQVRATRQAPLPERNGRAVGRDYGVLPFGCPGLIEDESRIVVPVMGLGVEGGLYVLGMATGGLIWGYTGEDLGEAAVAAGHWKPHYTLAGGVKEQVFGVSQSSPAIDVQGNIYVGSDAPDNSYEEPVLFAFNKTGHVKWVTLLGGDDDRVGHASPVLASGPLKERRVYMASTREIITIEPGCQLGQNGAVCSGHGKCDCAKQQCVCDNCWDMTDTCSSENTCSGHGTCDAATNKCKCTGNYKGDDCDQCKPCYSGDNCDTLDDCNGHGTCNKDTGKCKCSGNFKGDSCTKCKLCYSGDNCDTENDCGGHGTCEPVAGCVCNNNYRPSDNGQSCSACTACYFGFECAEVRDCNLHGVCHNDEGCKCRNGYTGDNCATCNEACWSGFDCGRECGGNGHCNGKGTKCECNHGWRGSHCTEQINEKKRGGAIAGGVISGLLLVGLGAGVFVWYQRFPGRSFKNLPGDAYVGAQRLALSAGEGMQGLMKSGQRAPVVTSSGGGYGAVGDGGAGGGGGGGSAGAPAAGTGSYTSL